LRKSKTDQELRGRWIYPRKITAEKIQLWIAQAQLQNGFLFRGIRNSLEVTEELNSSQINRIYKRLARTANLPQQVITQISGHSIRVGATQDLIKSGASLPIIMNRGRWSKADTVMRYAEFTENFNFGNYF
jgi:integrase